MWTSIAALIGGSLLKKFTFETAKYLAMRAFLIALCLGLGPIVLFKGFSYILQFMLSYGSSYMGSQELTPVTVQLSGVGGYIASALKLPEAFSIFLSFCLLSFTLRMIRVK